MSGFIAVHCGAGYHKHACRKEYKKICKAACKAGANILKSGGSPLEACQISVMMLEDCPLTNAGVGSNLSMSGDVECDASVMNGEDLNYGACGCVKKVRNPVALATQICTDQRFSQPLQKIPPNMLVGEGAEKYAQLRNLMMVDNKELITTKARKSHSKFKRLIEKEKCLMKQSTPEKVVNMYKTLDTVGAVCVDSKGHVASACSSGGISMKHDGRVGQAACYASGVWADSYDNIRENSVAVSTTGAGEYLVKTLLARQLGSKLKIAICPTLAFVDCMKRDFLESKYIDSNACRIGGALALQITPSGLGELLWGHSSRTMGVAYMNVAEETCGMQFSELPLEKEGKTVTVSGVKFEIEKNVRIINIKPSYFVVESNGSVLDI